MPENKKEITLENSWWTNNLWVAASLCVRGFEPMDIVAKDIIINGEVNIKVYFVFEKKAEINKFILDAVDNNPDRHVEANLQELLDWKYKLQSLQNDLTKSTKQVLKDEK